MNTWSNPWFDTWKDLTQTQPWQSTLENWWAQFSKQPPTPSMQAFENIVEQGRAFFKMTEELGSAMLPKDATADWEAALDQIFGNLKQAFDKPDAGQAQNLFWRMPLANWERTMSSLSGLPGDPFAGMSVPHFDPKARLDQFLSTPGVGYAREFQGEYQKLARLVVEYQKAHQQYAAVFAEVNRQSLDCLRDRLLARMREGEKPITSMRELYDLWVDCGEEVYAREVMTDKYAELHGEMINTLMAVKHQLSSMIDDAAGAMNLPTRTEMDTIHQRFQASRRGEKRLEQELSTLRTEARSMARQVERLRDEMEELRRAKTPKRKKKETGKKAKAKKKTGRAGGKSGGPRGKRAAGKPV